jgi:hypothetical protein
MADMADEVRQRLEDLCGKIEQAFPGVFCAYSGFAQPRLPTEDGDLVVEVFFAPPGASRAVTRATVENTRKLRQELGVSVAVVVHYTEDTVKYYLSDVLAILMARQGAPVRTPQILDLAGFPQPSECRDLARESRTLDPAEAPCYNTAEGFTQSALAVA